MNKIYKVIWSKVKNQYVVVSELAHSSGKQIRTSRSSIRSRIAALVVCGAIAAFGVLPMNLASADNIHINIDNVNSFANGNGTTVTETKDSHKDDITISFGVNTGDGLTVDGENNVVIDLASGKGLDFYNDKIGIKLANKSGLTFINGGLSIDENLTKNITNLQSATINGGNVDENGNINLTHTENDITTQVTSIDGLKDYALKDKQYITKDKSGATILTLQDQYDPNNTKDVKIDGLVTYNNGTKNGEVTGIDYGNIRLAGEIVKDPKTGKETNIGTRITNLKDGWIDEKSTDAVNGSQLYNVDQKVNAGWKANVINGQTQSKINIRPNGKDEVGKDTLSFIAGDNVTLTAIDNSIKIGTDLKDLNVEDTNAVLYDKDIDGNVDKGSITLAGGENGTQIHNLADGDLSATSKDAVNGSQLIGKTGDLQYNTDNHYVTNDENLTVSIGKLDDQVFTNTTNITELQGATINGGNVDENGNINLTHTENDITTQVTSIDGLKDYALKDKQYITKDKSGATILTLQDQYDPNNTKDVKIDGLVTYNNGTKNGEVTGIDYGNIRLAGEIVKDPKTGKETNIGTRITNLKDGWIDEKSTDAVNGSQLYAIQQEAGKHTIVTVNGGTSAPEPQEGQAEGMYSEDGNLQLKQTVNDGQTAYDIKLNSVLTLDSNGADNNKVVLDGNNGTISATNTVKKSQGQGPGRTTTNEFIFNNEGATFTNIIEKGYHDPIISTTKINGGTITTDTVKGLNNTTIDYEGFAKEGKAATEEQLKDVYDGSVKYWKKQDGTYDKSFIQLEGGEKGTTITHLKDGVVAEYSTEAINGSQLWETQQQIKDVETTANKHTIVSTTEDSNLTVENVAEKGEAANYQVALKDDITLKGDNSSIELNGTKGTIQVNQETAEGTNFTNINGNVVSIGYTNSEGIENAIVIDGGKGTITGLSNTTWDDELAKQVADSEELQGTAATQGQLQQAVSEVSGIVNKGWTAKAGDNDGEINITPGDTLNFEGDGNITVSATKESNELKFGLNDNITLGDKAGQKTSTSLTLYTDPSPIKDKDGNYVFNKEGETVTGYVPESYIDDQGRVDDFVSTHGGFMMYATDTSGQGVFGITTDGMVHAKDVISYMPNPDSNSGDKILKYSLNDIGDIVTQIAHGKFTSGNNATGMEYTLISDFTGETDKENPFVAVDENGNPTERTIGLAVRQDGAVVVGAVVDSKGVMSNETGIRINDADTETGGGKDTITGLSNTDWRPAAIRDSISTFGTENDDDSKAKIEASKAATQGQLDAMYDTVVGYDINESKTGIDYSTITLKGTPYGSTKDGNGSHEGGTLITNVAYAVTDTDSDKYNGSAAVNVDLLKDTVADVTSQASNSDRYLTSGKLDGNTLSLTVSDLNGYNNVITIGNIASKDDISNINKEITNINNQITNIKNQIGGGTGTGGNNNTTITGGKINDDGTISLDKNNGEPSITLEGQLTGSSVIQDGTKFDGESGTLTIMTQNDYGKDKVQTPITVEGIASKDDIEAVNDTIGATSKEDLKDKYKDTEYLKDENGETVETLADADIALDHAVQGLVTNDKYLNSRIDNVEKRLGDVEQRIDKVGAMAAAIANLRTMGFDPEAPTEIAVGVGQYKSETGLAIGVFHYPNQDFMLSASLSTSGDEVMGGIGATWRIGRKTAAEKAKDEEKRILAKAEEIKQAAKRAEVKAQADRHAKLLAEREAKGESIRPIENKVEQTQEQA